MACALCKAVRDEEGVFENDIVKILRTKKMKGHTERVMIVTKKHDFTTGHNQYLRRILELEGPRFFQHTYKFVIVAPDFATIPDHPHLIACDLEPGAEDWDQLLGTHWLRVVDVRAWK